MGRVNLLSTNGASLFHVGSTGELRVVGGNLNSNPGSHFELADGARALFAGNIGSNVDLRLNGASTRVVVEQSPALVMGDTSKSPTLQSHVGGQVIYTGKGNIVSANMSGSNVRATVENETTLMQRDSTAGVSLTFENQAQMIYIPRSSGHYVNSLGGPLTVTGQTALGVTSQFSNLSFFIASARLDMNNRLIMAPGSTLDITRTGADIANGAGRFTVNFASLLPWEIGANTTLIVNNWTTLEGLGLTYLSNPHLTTRVEGISTLDLTNSFGNRIINRLSGSSTSARVEAGTNLLTINGGDFGGQLHTSGGVRIGGDTTLHFRQTYSGGTEILSQGTLRLAGIATLGSGPITNHGTLDVSGLNATTLTFTELGGAGQVQHGSRRINFNVPSARVTTVANSFQGSGPLAKEGAGTLRLIGNSLGMGQGDFLVNAGTLLVDGQIQRRFVVGVWATLGGNGRVRDMHLQTGSVISPGNSIGAFISESATWEAGATYRWEINHAEGTPGGAIGWDTIHMDGTLTIVPSFYFKFILSVTSLGLDGAPGPASGFSLNQTYEFTLVTATGGIQGFTPGGFVIHSNEFNDGLGEQGNFSIFQNGNDLVLRYQTIPEPSSALVLLVAAGLFHFLRRQPTSSLRKNHAHHET